MSINPDINPGVNAGGDQRMNTSDPFFNEMSDVLKTYSFNYEALAKFKKDVAYTETLSQAICCFPFCPCFMLSYNCNDKPNIDDEVYARHIALTADGIRYIVDKHMAGCRRQQDEKGRTSQTVPYDKITDCDVEEPAGSEGCECMPVPRTMYTFSVSTSGGPGLELWGIDAPYELKKDVWSMKRGQGIEGISGSAIAPSAVSMMRGGDSGMPPSSAYAGGGIGGGGCASTDYLLGEILNTLKEQNDILRNKC